MWTTKKSVHGRRERLISPENLPTNEFSTSTPKTASVGKSGRSAAAAPPAAVLYCRFGTNNKELTEMEGGGELERDSDGNAICPACLRSIGKDSAQWAKHLEEERTQLQLAIQDLKETALGNAKAHLADAGTRQSPSPAASASTENCSQQQKADRILTRIRDNQRNRIDAKLKGRFFLASLSLTNILKANNAATNQKCEQPPVQGNGHRHGEEEQETESTGKAEAPAVEEQTKSPFSTFCADGRNGRREDMERKPLCMQCQSHAELLVLNVHSGTAQCLDCFAQRKQQLQTGNGGPPTESSMPSNGHPPKATGNGFGTPAPMAKKRVSPFSALELAESNGVGTKERCEHEQQKRPKLEAE